MDDEYQFTCETVAHTGVRVEIRVVLPINALPQQIEKVPQRVAAHLPGILTSVYAREMD